METNENDMTFSCLGRYCIRPTPMAALMAQTAADARLSSLMRNMADITSCQTFILFYQLTLRNGVREIRSVLNRQ